MAILQKRIPPKPVTQLANLWVEKQIISATIYCGQANFWVGGDFTPVNEYI